MLAISDGVAISTGGIMQRPLSVRQIMECSAYEASSQPGGCDGNDVAVAAQSLVESQTLLVLAETYPRAYSPQGISTSDCGSFSPDRNGNFAALRTAFSVIEPIGAVGDAAHKRNIENMKQHIFQEGPIVTCMNLSEELANYDGVSIFEPSEASKNDPPLGGYAVEVLGWGVDPTSKVKYWVCRNAWGQGWPPFHKRCAGVGFFYVRMGVDCMQMESWQCISLDIQTHAVNLLKKLTAYYPGEESYCATHLMGSSALYYANPVHSASGRILVVCLVAAGLLLAYKFAKKPAR
jgi:hypothetical protein